MKVAIYARVSTADQNQELQLRELQDYATRHQWEIAQIYQDIISGASASRPGLNQLMDDGRARNLDTVLCWKLDRFGRSLRDCLNNLWELDSHGVRFIAVTQGLDTDNRNPASRFLLQVLGAAAEFERELIRERSKAGRFRYLQDFKAGRVGKTVSSRSGKNLPPRVKRSDTKRSYRPLNSSLPFQNRTFPHAVNEIPRRKRIAYAFLPAAFGATSALRLLLFSAVGAITVSPCRFPVSGAALLKAILV